MTLATTGIAGLDAQLGGGIPRGTTLLLIGEPGNGMPMFCEQFAGGGLDIGDDVHFFEYDRPVAGMRSTIQSFIARGNEKKAQLTLYDGYSTQFGAGTRTRDANALPVGHGEALPMMRTALENQVPGRPYRVVIDSFSTLLREENEREVVDFARNLVYVGQELGGLHIIALVKGLHPPAVETQLRHIATGVIEFGAERKGFGIYNYLIVSKLLNVKDPVRILLWKETDKGLWFESTKRVF
jgi:KaiC/GvpD/RAD55 family RecA-like ATPase